MTIPISQIKTQLGITGTDEDARLNILVPQAIALASSYCNRPFEETDFTETYDGRGTHELILDNSPVISVTSIHESETRTWDSDSLLTEGTDYIWKASGVVTRLNTWWSYGLERGRGQVRGAGGYYTWGDRSMVSTEIPSLGTIRVIYSAGYDVLPKDIEFAIGQIVATMLREASTGAPLASESLDYYSYQLKSGADADQSMTSARNILKSYCIPVI